MASKVTKTGGGGGGKRKCSSFLCLKWKDDKGHEGQLRIGFFGHPGLSYAYCAPNDDNFLQEDYARGLRYPARRAAEMACLSGEFRKEKDGEVRLIEVRGFPGPKIGTRGTRIAGAIFETSLRDE